ncbi:MAG: hypothetical protein H0T89_09365 [Deltaproteobacteria bacterium]|nr:hypothetical protein [Deltaproteobacteria bacterium]
MMAVPRKTTDAAERDQDRDQDRDQTDSQQPPTGAPKKPTGKTLQELERIQFDVLDRAGFDR